MQELLLFTYITNASVLLVHEMDSTYWKEWDMFHLPGGLSGFLLLHIPLVMLVLYGLLLLERQSLAGFIFSLALATAGIIAFSLHTWFLKKEPGRFHTPCSRFLLYATLVVSLIQAALTILVYKVA